MAGLHRIRFIPQTLYVYNQESPYNDAKLRCPQQMFYTDHLAKKDQYPYMENF